MPLPQYWNRKTIEERMKIILFEKTMRHPTYAALRERWANSTWEQMDEPLKEATRDAVFLWQAYGRA